MKHARQWSKYTTHNTYVDANKVLWFKRLLDDTNNGVLEVFLNNVFETHVLYYNKRTLLDPENVIISLYSAFCRMSLLYSDLQ